MQAAPDTIYNIPIQELLAKLFPITPHNNSCIRLPLVVGSPHITTRDRKCTNRVKSVGFAMAMINAPGYNVCWPPFDRIEASHSLVEIVSGHGCTSIDVACSTNRFILE